MVKLNLIYKKGQAWGVDLMIAVMIFSVALVSFYLYSLNEVGGTIEISETLSYDGRAITNILLSSGTPEDWNEGNVIEMGILTDDKINETKLERFYNFALNNYSQTKRVFNTKFDYYFFLDRNMTINSIEVDGIGKPGVTRNNIDVNNLIKISRVTVYENRLVGAKLYIWK